MNKFRFSHRFVVIVDIFCTSMTTSSLIQTWPIGNKSIFIIFCNNIVCFVNSSCQNYAIIYADSTMTSDEFMKGMNKICFLNLLHILEKFKSWSNSSIPLQQITCLCSKSPSNKVDTIFCCPTNVAPSVGQIVSLNPSSTVSVKPVTGSPTFSAVSKTSTSQQTFLGMSHPRNLKIRK